MLWLSRSYERRASSAWARGPSKADSVCWPARIVFTGEGSSISRTSAPALVKAAAASWIAVTASACSSSLCGV